MLVGNLEPAGVFLASPGNSVHLDELVNARRVREGRELSKIRRRKGQAQREISEVCRIDTYTIEASAIHLG